MNLKTAPIDSVRSIEFYKQVLTEPLKTCFKYLAYLSLIGALFATVSFTFYVFPELNKTAQWAEREFPDITWTPEGIVMNAASPYEMVHPNLGALIVFNTNVDEIDPETMGNVAVVVTATRLYVRRDQQNVSVYDLTRDPTTVNPDQGIVQITGESLKKMYDKFSPLLFLAVPFFTGLVFFVFKLFETLVYTLVGVLISVIIKKRLPYELMFKVSAFALTAATFIQWRGFIHPVLSLIPFGSIGGLIVTSIYLYKILKSPDVFTAAPEENTL